MMNFVDFVLCLLIGFVILLVFLGFVVECVVVYVGSWEMGLVGWFFVFWFFVLVCGLGLFVICLVEGFCLGEEMVGE